MTEKEKVFCKPVTDLIIVLYQLSKIFKELLPESQSR